MIKGVANENQLNIINDGRPTRTSGTTKWAIDLALASPSSTTGDQTDYLPPVVQVTLLEIVFFHKTIWSPLHKRFFIKKT